MTEAKSSKALLMPLMAGLFGAGLALLFAPRSGKETRDKLRTKAEDMKERADEGMTSVRESLDQAVQEAQDLKDRLSAAVAQTGRKAKQEMNEGEDRDKLRTPAQSSVLSTWEEEV